MAEPPRHDAARGRQDLLYDADIATPSHAERAVTLAARGGDASLASSQDGHPYASLVLFALHDHAPVLLISNLAAHTVNLRADPRCSLMVREGGHDNPLAIGRVTLVGHAAPTDAPEARAAFLARHPDAARYADFRDFGFWAIAVDKVRYIGGFGRMSWVDEGGWSRAMPDPIDAAAAGILAHMNDDHVDAMRAYCRAFSRAGQVDEVTMTSVDRYGFEMSAVTADGPRPIRVAFDAPVATAMEVRNQMVALVKRARQQLG